MTRDADIAELVGLETPPEAPEKAASGVSVPGLPEVVSLDTLAALLDITAHRVNELARQGGVVRVGRGRYDLAGSVRAYVASLKHRGRDQAAEKTRLTAAQADLAEAKLRATNGELVETGAVEREWARVLRDVKAGCLAIAPRLQSKLGHLSPYDVQTIDSEIRAVLAELAGVDTSGTTLVSAGVRDNSEE